MIVSRSMKEAQSLAKELFLLKHKVFLASKESLKNYLDHNATMITTNTKCNCGITLGVKIYELGQITHEPIVIAICCICKTKQ